MLLKDRVALITGAARGIGLATANIFADNGATVVMLDRNAGRLDSAQRHILESHPGINVTTLVCDVSDESSVRLAFNEIFKQFKRLDVLVSNAGILADGLIGMVRSE